MANNSIRVMGLALWLALSQLTAQAAPAVPDTGSILQQVQPVGPPVPSSSGTGLKIEREGAAQWPPSAPFEVKTLHLSGNTLFDTRVLHGLVADAEGKTLTLAQLDELAAKITEYYRSHGYPLARAFIPAQTIEAGVVRIEIVEARYGKIRLDNHSRVGDPLLDSTLAPLQSGQAIEQKGLDRSLLLLTDIPGIAINATLKPGEAVGTADLLVEAAPVPAASGHMVLDNYGGRYTGKARAGLTANYSNPLRYGDVLSFNATTSGRGMSYGRIGYESLLNGRGSRMGASYSALRYTLGESLAPLDAHGTATVASLWAKHPLLRGQGANLNGQLQYDRKQLRDRIDAASIQTDRHLNNWTASLSGDMRDELLNGAVNTWSLGWTSGRLGFDDASAQMADTFTSKTQGRYKKWNASLSRLQTLSPQSGVYFTLSGQGASANLDSAEKMSVGGPYSVRAYEMGAISGDTGYNGTVEFSYNLSPHRYGQWQAVIFADSAQVRVNRNTWAAGENGARLSGTGVGFNWAGQNQWSAKAYAAWRLGLAPTLVESSAAGRAWVEIGKRF